MELYGTVHFWLLVYCFVEESNCNSRLLLWCRCAGGIGDRPLGPGPRDPTRNGSTPLADPLVRSAEVGSCWVLRSSTRSPNRSVFFFSQWLGTGWIFEAFKESVFEHGPFKERSWVVFEKPEKNTKNTSIWLGLLAWLQQVGGWLGELRTYIGQAARQYESALDDKSTWLGRSFSRILWLMSWLNGLGNIMKHRFKVQIGNL